jgi:type IV secretory pathway VirB9-like protein
MKRVFMLVVITLILSHAPYSMARDAGSCKTIHHQPGRVNIIKTALYQGTHITLPAKLLIDPVVGDVGLWNVDGDGHHVMVQPNSAEPQGKRTTLTLIDKNNVSYDFQLVRVGQSDPFDICVNVENSPPFFQGKKGSGKSPLETYTTPEEARCDQLQDQIKFLTVGIEREKKLKEEKINDILKKYRSFIYTRYSWNAGTGFKGQNLVTDVYDDGRFTFIRMTPDNRGLLVVSAEVDGKKEMIEYVAESETIYRISGIYPEFNLRYGNSNVTVSRRDNSNNGVY